MPPMPWVPLLLRQRSDSGYGDRRLAEVEVVIRAVAKLNLHWPDLIKFYHN